MLSSRQEYILQQALLNIMRDWRTQNMWQANPEVKKAQPKDYHKLMEQRATLEKKKSKLQRAIAALDSKINVFYQKYEIAYKEKERMLERMMNEIFTTAVLGSKNVMDKVKDFEAFCSQQKV